MRPVIFKLFLLAISISFARQAYAQTCTGSLGDPVINQDFGSGTNPGNPLAGSITNMTYTSGCPNDGQYSIVNSIINSVNYCHPDTWHDVPHDHTGNTNGYMMLVNASEQPSIFFTQTANGLCPGTTYEFSAYILNLIKLSAVDPTVSQPDITFAIKTLSGEVLATYLTKAIPSTDAPQWNKYGVYFTTPATVTDVVVVMTNNAPGGNGNDLVLDDITFRACGPIIEAGFASTTGPVSQPMCEGTNATYSLQAKVFGNGNPVYQWQSNKNSAGWTDVMGATSNSINVPFTNAIPGIYQYRLGVGNGSDISSVTCRVYSAPLTITVNPLPVIPVIAPQSVCEGTPLTLTASGGSSYLWSGPGISPTSQNPLIINSASLANTGTYIVQVKSDAGCSSSAQVVVKVLPKIVPVVSNGTSGCAGTSNQLTALGGSVYKWTPSAGLDHDNIANPVATPLQTTTYRVDIGNGSCDDSSKTVTVTVWQNPVASGGGDKVIFEGQSVKLNGTEMGDQITSTYWTPATSLSDPNSLTPVASPTNDITYTLNVVSLNCGIQTSNVFVRVYKKINIPNSFTPNNDGKNETWDIDELITYPESSVMIFDRYGRTVFQSTGYGHAWDGKLNGRPLSTGTYYYVIDLKNNTPKLSGWVLLAR